MITKSKPKSDTILPILVLLLFAAAIAAHYALEPWGFYRKISGSEAALRMQVVQTAESYLGCRESDGSHEAIIDLYNAHEPLAQNYTVQYTDSWCATFVSAVSIRCGLTAFPQNAAVNVSSACSENWTAGRRTTTTRLLPATSSSTTGTKNGPATAPAGLTMWGSWSEPNGHL